jgi:DNA-binding LytR/AlgR family response regulator
VLFLDIQMPGMTGFELLARLTVQPFVIFTTAYDEFALRAFEVNSIDYLVKPIETDQLARALKKLGRLRPVPNPNGNSTPAARSAAACRIAAGPQHRISAAHRLPRRRADLVS